jgi:hypothetical protein
VFLQLKRGGSVGKNTIKLPGDDMAKVNALIDLLRSKGHSIESVMPQRFSLEDVFVEVLGGEGESASGARPVGRTADTQAF